MIRVENPEHQPPLVPEDTIAPHDVFLLHHRLKGVLDIKPKGFMVGPAYRLWSEDGHTIAPIESIAGGNVARCDHPLENGMACEGSLSLCSQL